MSEDSMTRASLSVWYVYMVRCADSSLYTGITTDLVKRLTVHNSPRGGAKYTRARQPVNLVFQQGPFTRSVAASQEYALKKYSKRQKEQLVAISGDAALESVTPTQA